MIGVLNVSRAAALALATLLLPLSLATAQSEPTTPAFPKLDRLGRAEALHQQALELYESNTLRAEASARLLMDEVRLRGKDDPATVPCMILAARFYGYGGDTWKARHTMEAAARQAAQLGEVALAAHAFVDAAFLAVELGDNRGAIRLVETADQLAGSTLLTANESERIRWRIGRARIAAKPTQS